MPVGFAPINTEIEAEWRARMERDVATGPTLPCPDCEGTGESEYECWPGWCTPNGCSGHYAPCESCVKGRVPDYEPPLLWEGDQA